MKYDAHHARATKTAVHNSRRCIDQAQRMILLIGAFASIGRADQLLPRTSDSGIAKTLALLADSVDKSTPVGTAVVMTMARTPKAFAAWVRRNRARVQQILGP